MPARSPNEAAERISRLRTIEELLRQERQVTVTQLASTLAVSDMTVRRYLTQLQDEGIAERVHGGAVLVDRTLSDPLFLDRRSRERTAKAVIGRTCADLIPERATVFIGGGTTTLEVAQWLAGRSDLTLMTSNLAAAATVKEGGARVIVIGGEVHGRVCAMVGDIARTALSMLYAEVAVIGADAISAEHGLTSVVAEEAVISRMMLERATAQRICVVDSTKIALPTSYRIAGTDALTDVVTDANATQSDVDEFERLGVDVHRADVDVEADTSLG